MARGRRGVRFITSDDHAGLVAARKAVFPGAVWQRCQFHLARNAIHVEIDEQWIAADRACITMNSRDG